MNQTLDQLENRIRQLLGKLKQMDDDNARLQDELSLLRTDFNQQNRLLEEERAKYQDAAALMVAAPELGNDELSEKIQFQEQQIQLLEKERLNLRDQIAFLQNTIQNKEKDWQDKLQQVRNELSDKTHAQEEVQAAKEAKIAELIQQLDGAQTQISSLHTQLDEQKIQAALQEQEKQASWDDLNTKVMQQQASLSLLENDLSDSQKANEKLKAQVQAAQQELEECRQNHSDALLEQHNQAQEALQQELERHQQELAQQAKEHLDAINHLSDELDAQKAQWQSDRSSLQEQILKLNTQNQEYRSLLMQSARDIRALLQRLPAVEEAEIESGENA